MDSNSTKPRIFIDKRGDWFQDGIKITHRWTYLENNRNLDVDNEGRFFVDDGAGKLYVEVEDTPFVVKMIDSRDGRFYLLLNDGTREEFNLEDVRLNTENVPYTTVKNNKFEARFLRPAYYELMKNAEQEGDEFYFNCSGKRIKIETI